MPLKEKTGTCKGFVFKIVPEHEKKNSKLNGKTLENRTIVIEHKTSTRNKET